MIIERNIQHQRIRTECEESSSIRATSVLDVFEKLAAAGVSLKPGVQIRFGWSLLHLVQEDQGLRVTEPDFAIWPKQRWILTIDTTLNVLALQASLLHELGVEGEDIRLRSNDNCRTRCADTTEYFHAPRFQHLYS